MRAKTEVIMGVVVALALTALAAEKLQTGPRGGRLLERTSPVAEFLVEKDRTVSIAFYDSGQKQIPAGTQQITVIAEAANGKVRIEFEKKDALLVSKTRLPDGDGYNVVVQHRSSAEAKPQNHRFVLDLSACGGCKFAEYACSCH